VSWATRSAAVAVIALVQENVTHGVSRSQARPVRASADPPQRSTTARPRPGHGPATDEGRHRRPEIPPVGEARLEDLANSPECGIDPTVHGGN
jgi:hypothetical protein